MKAYCNTFSLKNNYNSNKSNTSFKDKKRIEQERINNLLRNKTLNKISGK